MKSKKFFKGIYFKVKVVLAMVFLLEACDIAENKLPESFKSDQNVKSKIEPVLSSLSPAAAFITPEPVELTIYGENFSPDSTVTVNGINIDSEYVSEGKLRCWVNFERLKQDLNLSTNKNPYTFVSIQMSNGNNIVSDPLTWPLRKAAFNFTSPKLLFDEKAKDVIWDMEVDGNQGVHIVREKFLVVEEYLYDALCRGVLSIISSFDNGRNWNKSFIIRKGLGGYYDGDYGGIDSQVDLACDSKGNLFIAFDDYYPAKLNLAVSQDRGKTWEVKLLIQSTKWLKLIQLEIIEDRLFLICKKGYKEELVLMISDDQGQNWRYLFLSTDSGNARIGYDKQKKRIFLFVNNNNYYSRHDYMRYSQDFGQTWSDPADFFQNMDINQVMFGPDNTWHAVSAYLHYYYHATWYEYHYRSSIDNGLTWLNDLQVDFDHIAMDQLGLIYGSSGKWLYISNTDGRKWNQIEHHLFYKEDIKARLIRIDRENTIHWLDYTGKDGFKTFYSQSPGY